jgi:hypothetical protein
VQVDFVLSVTTDFLSEWENVKNSIFCAPLPISKQEPVSHATKATHFPMVIASWVFKKTPAARSSPTEKENNAKLVMINFMSGSVYA